MHIVLDCQPIHHLVTLDKDLTRPQYVAAQKQALHAYRLVQLSQYLGRNIQASELLKTEHGKPYLPDLAFNHSHSQQHYALVMSRTQPDIGVDIEDLDRKVRFGALAEHAFTHNELQAWYASGQDTGYWFQIWTAKEAIVKAAGLGIRLSLNTLETNVKFGHMQGEMQHPSLGAFEYEHRVLEAALVTIAWRKSQIRPHITCA